MLTATENKAPAPAAGPRYLTPAEAAAHVRCSMPTIRRAIADGSVKAFRFRGRRLVDREALEATIRGEAG